MVMYKVSFLNNSLNLICQHGFNSSFENVYCIFQFLNKTSTDEFTRRGDGVTSLAAFRSQELVVNSCGTQGFGNRNSIALITGVTTYLHRDC